MSKLLSFLTFTLTISLYGMPASILFKKDLRLINVPVAGVYVAPDPNSSYYSQKIYGHWVEVIDVMNDVWIKVTMDDETVGYMQSKDLIPDNILWRTSKELQRIKSLSGCVYPNQSVYGQTIIRLPYNAYIKVTGVTDDKKWASVVLIDNTTGWIMTGDVEPIEPISMDQMLDRVFHFVGLPYIWGGVSSLGYDCSGFVQTIARQLGYPMLRNSGSQSRDSNLITVAYEDIQPGDFIYFGKDRISHVALCIAPNKIIHSAVIGAEPKLMITPIDLPELIFNCARRLPLP